MSQIQGGEGAGSKAPSEPSPKAPEAAKPAAEAQAATQDLKAASEAKTAAKAEQASAAEGLQAGASSGTQLSTKAAEGVKFTKEMNSRAETIATGRRPKGIDKIDKLVELFGGKASDWSKMKTLDASGREIHYFKGPGGR